MSPRRARAISGREGGDPAAALREHLIDTAERLLSERPVSAITTREIAEAAGVSDGVLYNYFADKNELLLTALERRFSRLVARFDSGLPEPGTATIEENLNAYTAAALELVSEALPLVAALITEPPLLHRFVDAIHRRPLMPLIPQRLAEYLHGEERLGRLAAVDRSAAITLLMGAAILGALSSHLGGEARNHVAHQIPAVIRTLVHGLKPPSAGGPPAPSA